MPDSVLPGFTRGPWKPVECAVTRKRAEDYVTALVRGCEDPAANLMVVTQASEDVTREDHIVVAVVGNGPQSPANSDLIAAAPDLLAALEWALDYLKDEPRDAAKAALAKARGAQP